MQNQSPNYLQLSPEDLAKIAARREREDAKLKVTEEWMLIAEFGMFFGYAAVQDVLSDGIDSQTMYTLIEAARKVEARQNYNLTSAVLVGTVSAHSKNPAQTFNQATRDQLKAMKADI